MATPTGGQFVFSIPDPGLVNLVLTPDGNVPQPTNLFDLEVFTVANGTTADGYDGSGFASGGTIDNNFLVAGSFTANTGDYWITNFGGTTSITAGAGNQTISGGIKDTIIGGTGTMNVIAGQQNTVLVGSASAATVNALKGDGLVELGANDATVYAGIGETVNAGAGKGTVIVGTAGTWISLLTGATADPTYTVHANGGAVSGGADSINAIGSQGDTFEFGAVGGATVNALKGDQNIFLGSGNATIYSGDGNDVVAGTGTGTVVFGEDQIVMAGPPTGDGRFTVTDGTGTFAGYSGIVNMVLNDGDTVSIGGQQATVNALNSNPQEINLGSNSAIVYAGVGDTVIAGPGSGEVLFFGDSVGGSSSNMTISGGPGDRSPFTIANTAGTFTGQAGNLNLVGLTSDSISTGEVVNATVNALGGNSLITLGTGAATVYAGNFDTVAAGSGKGEVAFSSGQTATISGTATETNITVVDSGEVFFGQAASAHIVGAEGDSIFVGAGDQTVNAIGGSTVQATGGSDVVFGGDKAEIGIGSTNPTAALDGNQLWLNSDLSDGSVGFGTFAQTVSTAQVTVGTVAGGAVSEGFDTANDFLFYENQNDATTAAIVATQQDVLVEGIASTELVLPDGTTMTLVGVTDITAGMFK